MIFSHKNVDIMRRKQRSSHCSWSWKQWCCLFVTIYCCLNHSAYGQLPSALTTTTTTIPTPRTTVAPVRISTAKTISPRVIVESIALDEHKKPINDEKTAAEILQLPHAFRHQQHYSQRIEQAVNDFKQQQQQQYQPKEHIAQQKQQESHLKERDKINNNNSTRRYHQRQSTVQWQDQQHHQRRHEHHLEEQQQQPLYHLRHRNHYAAAWEKQSIPTLRHQRHRNAYNITATTTTPILARPILQQPTTEGGIELDDNVDNGHDHLELQANGAILFTTNVTDNNKRNEATRRYFDRETFYRRQPVTKSPLNRSPNIWQTALINNSPDIMFADSSNGLSGKRLILKIQDKSKEFSKNDDNIDIDDDDDDDDDVDDVDDDDYSYEHSEEYAEKWNNLPTSKPPVKRFTNPFKNLFKSLRGNDATKHGTNKNVDEDIADEKYRLRVQQHHIRQQQHQQELEAMRSWHAGIGGNMLNSGLNKYTTNTNHNHQASFLSRLTHDLLLVD